MRTLRPGDRIAVVAPSGPVHDDLLDAGIARARALGFEVVEQPHVRDRDGFLAGGDDARLDDLHAAWADDGIAALWCARGGYGAQRLVDRIDWDLVRAHPKPFVGYSDATALHLALHVRARHQSVHGPNLEATPGRLGDASFHGVRDLLTTPPPPPGTTLLGGATCLHPGSTGGPLVGGNLSLVCATVGTPDAAALDGAVLLLEDVAEAPYRLDRLLLHLGRAGVLQRAAGLVLGGFTECGDRAAVDAVLRAHVAAAGRPAVTGWELGHGPDQRPLRHGGRVHLDADAGTLSAS